MQKNVIIAQVKRFSQNRKDKGFTDYVKGKEKRYIVAFTNNKTKAKTWESARRQLNKTITRQILDYGKKFKTVTIGGWTDDRTETRYLDIGTSTDNLNEAIAIAKEYNQLAIWDNKTFDTLYV